MECNESSLEKKQNKTKQNWKIRWKCLTQTDHSQTHHETEKPNKNNGIPVKNENRCKS